MTPKRIDTGGPAFPRPTSIDPTHGDLSDGNEVIGDQEGMSLRDYFAGQVLAGLFAGGSVCMPFQEGYEKAPGTVAELAYRFADAMVDRRKGGAT